MVMFKADFWLCAQGLLLVMLREEYTLWSTIFKLSYILYVLDYFFGPLTSNFGYQERYMKWKVHVLHVRGPELTHLGIAWISSSLYRL